MNIYLVLVNLPQGGHSLSSKGNRCARRLPSKTILCTIVGFFSGFPSSNSSNLSNRI